MKDIERYHTDLHASAVDIGKHFRRADPELPGILAADKWTHLNGQYHPGCLPEYQTSWKSRRIPPLWSRKWLQSDQAKQAYAKGSPEFRTTWEQMLKPTNNARIGDGDRKATRQWIGWKNRRQKSV